MIDLLDIILGLVVISILVISADKWYKVSYRTYNVAIKILTVVLIIAIGTLTYSIN